MEKLKIQIDGVEFSTNENKDTICKVTYKNNELLDKLVFYGVAKLHPGDKYDKKMGQRISFAKAERKAYKHARKNVRKDITRLEEVLEIAWDFYNKADSCFVHNNDYIRQLCGCWLYSIVSFQKGRVNLAPIFN